MYKQTSKQINKQTKSQTALKTEPYSLKN